MQDEHKGFWSFPIFFQVLHWTGNKIFTFNQAFVTLHILPNIPRSKGCQAMKFGQLIEYNLRNIFVQKSYTKCAAETIPRPLSKISKLSISLDQ